MHNVVIYTIEGCPYCARAKKLLTEKNVEFKEIDASDPQIRQVLADKTGGKTSVPQIFVGDRLIGGSDDLQALEQSGQFDAMIKAA